jgi:hypothetical protein
MPSRNHWLVERSAQWSDLLFGSIVHPSLS